jgi:glutaredoxin
MANIKVYGADWCAMTTRSISFLESAGVDFDYIDVDKDHEASRWVKEQNGGKEKKPTIDIDGEILSEPDNEELRDLLVSKKLLAK